MNTYITLACLLAVLGLSQGSGIGYGYGSPLLSSIVPVSTVNVVKAPIPIIKPIVTAPIIKHIVPIYSPPVIRTVPVVSSLGYGSGLGLGGLGHGYGGLGYGGLGYGGLKHG